MVNRNDRNRIGQERGEVKGMSQRVHCFVMDQLRSMGGMALKSGLCAEVVHSSVTLEADEMLLQSVSNQSRTADPVIKEELKCHISGSGWHLAKVRCVTEQQTLKHATLRNMRQPTSGG